jgi:hypothetical protein
MTTTHSSDGEFTTDSKKIKLDGEEETLKVVSIVAYFCDAPTLCNMMLVSKAWRRLIKNEIDHVWKHLYEHTFGKHLPYNNPDDYRTGYITKVTYKTAIHGETQEQTFSAEDLPKIGKMQIEHAMGKEAQLEGQVKHKSFKNDYTGDIYHQYIWNDGKSGALFLNEELFPIGNIVQGELKQASKNPVRHDDPELRNAIACD